MPMSPFALISSTPILIPSIVFSIFFLLTSCLHLYRIIQTRRRVYILLFTFSFLRTILFIVRIVWSQNVESNKLALTSGILISGSFFIIVLAIYTLLRDWLSTISSNVSRYSSILTKYEQYTLNTVEVFLPAFSILFLIGSIKEFDTSTPSKEQGDYIIKFSMLCFLSSVAVYMTFITYFALKYGNKPIHLQLKVLVLYIVGALLLIELIYGVFMIFSQSTEKIERYSWVFYLFEIFPEVVILVILGGVILGEWFFKEEDVDSINSIKTISIGSIGNGNVNA